jgi:hypothetical protein
VPVKHGVDSEMISCISAPSIVATQLEQLGVRPGHRVMEAGAATGDPSSIAAPAEPLGELRPGHGALYVNPASKIVTDSEWHAYAAVSET